MVERKSISYAIGVAAALLLLLITAMTSPLLRPYANGFSFRSTDLLKNPGISALTAGYVPLYLKTDVTDSAMVNADAIERVEEDELVRLPLSELLFLRLTHSSSPRRPVGHLRKPTNNTPSEVLRC
jgi:hypothetical protein